MAILTLTSPVDINVPTKGALVLVKKDSFVSLLTNLNNRNNVCKQWYLLFQFYNSGLFPTASLFPGPLNLRDGRKTNPGNEVVFPSVFGPVFYAAIVCLVTQRSPLPHHKTLGEERCVTRLKRLQGRLLGMSLVLSCKLGPLIVVYVRFLHCVIQKTSSFAETVELKIVAKNYFKLPVRCGQESTTFNWKYFDYKCYLSK